MQDIRKLSPEEKLLRAMFGEAEKSIKLEIEGTTLRQVLDTAIDTLPRERQKRVIRMRFGLDNGCSKTLLEVGQTFNVTKQRIRQIEAQALRMLRHPTRSRGLKNYFES